ncbi:MAG: RnfH family protein [Hylemonella sp.]|uniref:RnfH family protein n=1 Tax=Hylemonella sp. TaxID=2066020 RepID=UPI0022BC3916|nr:RnfH family protein [Hylemonella sp.]MCZ8251237.1 RnfH family protein [Hylemonella sp.]
MQITLAFAPSARHVDELVLELPAGTTVRQALVASGWIERYPETATAPLGVWGRKAGPEQLLRAGDRVEIYRPLRVDPKVARRERFAKQGAGTAGLFAKRRAGAKAGY